MNTPQPAAHAPFFTGTRAWVNDRSLKLLPLLLLLFFPCRELQAQFAFATNNGSLTITAYTGPGGTVVIPSATNGLPVTSVGYQAFYFKFGVTNVTIPNSIKTIGGFSFAYCGFTTLTIPNSVTNIGSAAFNNCMSLTNVSLPNSFTSLASSVFGGCISLSAITIPSSVTTIESGAFSGCNSLTSIFIPGSVANIGSLAFGSCNGLTTITVDSVNPTYSSLNGVLFDKAQTTLIQCPGAKSGNYTIPNTILTIEDQAFLNCSSLTGIIIPSGVAAIGSQVFSGCFGLTNVTIPGSVTSIGYFAFQSCGALARITLPESVTLIGDYAFYGCSSLTTVTIPNSVSSIGMYAFEFCTGLTSLTIGNGITTIGAYAFMDCNNLSAVYFTGNAPSLGAGAFPSGNNLTIYYLPGALGWGPTFGGRPAAMWNPQFQTASSFGVLSNRFQMPITGTANIPILLEACTNLAAPFWIPLKTCTLTNGSILLIDTGWTNYPRRIYRIRSP